MNLKGWELLEDIVTSGKSAVYAAGSALSFVGLQYLNDHYWHTGMPMDQIPLFSQKAEVSFYLANLTCVLGAAYNSVATAYYALKVSLKLVSGEYVQRDGRKRNSARDH